MFVFKYCLGVVEMVLQLNLNVINNTCRCITTIKTYKPVRSSVGQEPSSQARQVYSSNTNSFSLQGVHVQQQLTSPLRITWKRQKTVCVSIYICVEAPSELVNYLSVVITCTFLGNQTFYLHGSTYLDLSFITGFTADRFDDGIFVGPDFIIINLQSPVVPAANINVVIVVLPHFFEVHNFIPVDKRQTHMKKTNTHAHIVTSSILANTCSHLWCITSATQKFTVELQYLPARWVPILIK